MSRIKRTKRCRAKENNDRRRRRLEVRILNGKELHVVMCTCGKLLMQRSIREKYCCAKCRSRTWYLEHRVTKELKLLTCKCGVQFKQKRATQKWCSIPCEQRFYANRYRSNNLEKCRTKDKNKSRELADSYIKDKLRQAGFIKITAELIERKREHLRLKRMTAELIEKAYHRQNKLNQTLYEK